MKDRYVWQDGFGGIYDCQEQAADYAEVISTIKRAVPSAEVYNVVVPTHVEFALPECKADFPYRNARHWIRFTTITAPRCKGVDVYDALSLHKLEYLYFNTDHHWTGLGAYYAYSRFAREAGLLPLSLRRIWRKNPFPVLLGLLYDITQEPVLEGNPGSVGISVIYVVPNDVSGLRYN